jgi:cation:H+ antiporter
MTLLDPAQLPVWGSALIFIVAASIVWIAGARLARVADTIARETGIGRELLGLLLLGGVTSLPELAVAVTATLQSTPALSINDVLGSAAINIVVLAVADAVGPRALTSMQGSPRVLLQGVLGMVLLAITAAAVITGDMLLGGIGLWSWLMLAFYIGAMALLSKSRAPESWVVKNSPQGGSDEGEADHRGGTLRPRLLWGAALAAGVILIAGFALARTGEALAEETGLGTSFFGAIFLGFSTSLPELSTVIAAVRMRQYEMAISDVFGTNLFNVTIIVLVDALHPGGPILPESGRFAAFAALLALALTAFFVAGMIERRNRTVLRLGYDSLAVLIVYAAGVVVLHGLR